MAYIGSKPADKPVVASDLDPTIITGQTALATAPADTDEFLISDAGVLKRLDASLIGGGKVLQVVTATDGTTRSTTSTSFVTGSNTLSVSITPSSASNKVFLVATSTAQGASGVAGSYYTIFRDATNLSDNDGFNRINSGIEGTMSISYLDSPNTTSATTYQVYFRLSGGSGTCSLNKESVLGSITAFEIGA